MGAVTQFYLHAPVVCVCQDCCLLHKEVWWDQCSWMGNCPVFSTTHFSATLSIIPKNGPDLSSSALILLNLCMKMLPLSFNPHCDITSSPWGICNFYSALLSCVGKAKCVLGMDLPCVHRHSCTGGWVWERDWCSSRYMVGCINVEGINKVLAQWIWTVSWKGWELLISVAHWFKKGQEIATRLQLWGGLSKALCWCKEELKSLRYYTSKGAAWGFRKKKTGKGICRHI